MPTVSTDIDTFLNATDNAAARTALGAGEPFTPLEITEAPPEDLAAIRTALGAEPETTESVLALLEGVFISNTGGFSTAGDGSGLETLGDAATIKTEGTNSHIYTGGTNSHILTQTAGSYIESRDTFKLYNGTYRTTVSHGPNANRTAEIGDASGVLPVIPAYADLTAANAALDSGDFWWDTTLKKLRTATA